MGDERKPRGQHGGARPGAGRPRAPGESYESARRRKESSLADLRELEVSFKRNELVHVRAVERRLFELVKSERETLLNWPASVSARLAATLGVDPVRLEVALEAEVRTLLASLTAAALLPERAA